MAEYTSRLTLCTSIECSYNAQMKGKYIRYLFIALWAILFATYTINMKERLKFFNNTIPGHCYEFGLHQGLVLGYLNGLWISLTCGVLSLVLALAIVSKTRLKNFIDWVFEDFPLVSRGVILLFGAGLFPFHLYAIINLRASNESLLNAGITEKHWGFGQMVAMVLLSNSVIVLVNGLQEDNKEHNASQTL